MSRGARGKRGERGRGIFGGRGGEGGKGGMGVRGGVGGTGGTGGKGGTSFGGVMPRLSSFNKLLLGVMLVVGLVLTVFVISGVATLIAWSAGGVTVGSVLALWR